MLKIVGFMTDRITVVGLALTLLTVGGAAAAPDFASLQVQPLSAAQAGTGLRPARVGRQGHTPRRPPGQSCSRLLLGHLVTGLSGGVTFRQPDLRRVQGQGVGDPAREFP